MGARHWPREHALDFGPSRLVQAAEEEGAADEGTVRLLVFALLAASCVNAPQETATAGQEGAPRAGAVRIGFSMDTLKEERWQRDKRLVEQRAQELGAVLDVQVANGDDAVQTKQADNMLTKGVDVLIAGGWFPQPQTV